ncbi:acyl carrier protein [Allopontixanthobacter sp.]|uniref:acyl carrier protein n=1 Tax=Allopontixanthobacter sp. TaxID=2906452 RepID=UPI002ABA9860|nr:acyl carrier protein [Allopontixanthobacter sp.]MDZ4308067.1 acyl carrier protein [Allopontixanthobacter sp.]
MTIDPAKEPVVAREDALAPSRSAVDALLRGILCDVLALDAELVDTFHGETGLFGHLPELDSMAVATLFTEMEDRLDILIEDDDVDGEMLESYGGLLAFAEAKTITGRSGADTSL